MANVIKCTYTFPHNTLETVVRDNLILLLYGIKCNNIVYYRRNYKKKKCNKQQIITAIIMTV